ncbi:MAG: Riboflavin biosynthesis protein RibBA [Alphaproteobacteria bacterium MarineAlpha9_Bin7]|nr:MAG: Riboflavin biosynthesis protein RibBA [Alphaproteobacteria bacterium MarineAlpha9_Bin7]
MTIADVEAAGRNRDFLSSIEEILDEASNGRMFVLVDDEDRENEGDLIIPAQMATPEAINFMAKFGRGLICLALPNDRVRELGLKPMERRNRSKFETAFLTSIEAAEGVTTGISAADRAHTIRVAIDPHSTTNEINTPGHVFPLEAQEGGVLVRAGHTEAAIDISRLAELIPAGVICEIMNDDGTMARYDDLVAFCQLHALRMATISDLIAYRRRTERLVEPIVESTVSSRYGGDFRMVVYKNTVEYAEHIALVKGDVSTPSPVLVRVHAVNAVSDLLGDMNSNSADDLHGAMKIIGDADRGVVVLIRDTSAMNVSRLVGRTSRDDRAESSWRDVGVGAQILLDLGVSEMILLSNVERAFVGLDGFGLRVVERRPIGATDV